MDKVTVIQADRDRAYPFRSMMMPTDCGPELWSSGLYDGEPLLQAFAKHRLATPAPDSEKLREAYLVWSNEHQAWWGKDRCGYTRFIDRAGRYDRSEALSIAGTRDGGWHVRKGNPDEIAIPERDAIDQYASITQSQRGDAALALGATS